MYLFRGRTKKKTKSPAEVAGLKNGNLKERRKLPHGGGSGETPATLGGGVNTDFNYIRMAFLNALQK